MLDLLSILLNTDAGYFYLLNRSMDNALFQTV
jgi:hypothetical protein